MLSVNVKPQNDNLQLKTSLEVLTSSRMAAWSSQVRQRLGQLVEDPSANLGHLEQALEAAVKELALPMLQAAAQAKADRVSPLCPSCGQGLRMEARGQVRTVKTIFGAIRLGRDYGWCRCCQQWFHPADQAMGLAAHAPASPRLQEMASLLVLQMPSAQAQIVGRRMGITLGQASLQREAQRQGLRAMRLRDNQAQATQKSEGVARLADQAKPTLPESPFTLVIEMDAFLIRERDQWGRTQALRRKGQEVSRWHWVYTGTCFRLDQRGRTASGRAVITERGYVATRQGLEAFDRQLYAEALLRGLSAAKDVLVIADGAVWIWNLVENRYKYATQRLDLYHAREHLWAVAHEIYGEGTPEAQQWMAPLLKQLDQNDDPAAEVMSRLDKLKKTMSGLTEKKLAMIEREKSYFKTHQGRMDYANAKKNQQPQGSGAIESTCHQYQCRFKRPGQFWTLAGDEALLALETLYRNGRWDQLFAHAKEDPKTQTN
jgi:hypothetical protein